jgi:CHASE2 domain-containing sensor protein
MYNIKDNQLIKNILKNRILTVFFVSLFIFLAIFTLSTYNATLQIVNKSIQDNYYRARNDQMQSKVSDKIIVVEIDEKTL